MSVTGVNKIMAGFRRIEKRSIRNLSGAMEKRGSKIIKASKKITPIDTGLMVSTTEREKTVIKGGFITVPLVTGGNDAKGYTIKQHEDLSLQHKPGKTAKFLEKPAKDQTKDFVKDAVLSVKKAIII